MAERRVRRESGWTDAHVRRLLWRAGFGAEPGEVRRWQRRGKAATISWLVAPRGAPRYRGPAPLAGGFPLDPVNEFGHDKLLWLDRMVRTSQPLREKMTLFWHDHFATNRQPTPLMLAQNETMRRGALGTFPALLRAMTLDPALARSLSLTKSVAAAPNENFARELMELFTLGSGYTETDIREASRALTGLRETRVNGLTTGLYFDPSRHDGGEKTIFGMTGAWGWEDVLRLCVEHPAHAPFLVSKLWDFFVGTPLREGTRRELVATYVGSGHRLRPLLRRILADPALYARLDRPDMVKWPAVLVAGQLRTMGAPVRGLVWNRIMSEMGQVLFAPPSVAGWDWGTRWLSSNAMRARFEVANVLTGPGGPASVRRGQVRARLSADQHLALAAASVGDPVLTEATEAALRRLIRAHTPRRRTRASAEELQRMLRHLMISGPDNQLC
jgi:uncharacterized protein (DUF1800 family)